MSRQRSSADDGDLLAFALAVGNYSDVAAAAAAHPTELAEIGSEDAEPAVEEPELVIEPDGADVAEPDSSDAEAPIREAIVPLLGMRMGVPEVALGFARLVRAGNLTDAPEDATGSDENVFATIGCGGSMQAPLAATNSLRQVVTSLRLMKAGGVGLGAHGWVPGLQSWQRFSTGVGRPRGGGYELTAGEADALVEMARRIADRGERTPAFAWALARFDLGAERPNQVEALSDYLLALRALLEGGGPAKAGLTARGAALCAGVEERAGVRATLEHAIGLERKMMSGERVSPAERSPLEVISAVEEVLRTLLRGMATGELGSDLRVTADEILLADGLRVGEGSALPLGGTAEWRVVDDEQTAEWRIPDLAEAERIVAERGELSANLLQEPQFLEAQDMETQRLDVPELKPGETPELEPPGAGVWSAGVEAQSSMAERKDRRSAPAPDWLSDEADLSWPAFASPRSSDVRREPPSERVRYLFPVPDETDWSIGDLSLDRKRNRAS